MLLLAAMSGCASDEESAASDSPQAKAAQVRYRAYLEEAGKELVHWAWTISAKVEEGSAPKAGSRYAAARVPLGHIGPVAVLSEPLISRIDSNAPMVEIGFHRIERALAEEESLKPIKPIAKRLLADVKLLQRQVDSADLQPAAVMRGADAQLDEIVGVQLPGKEERYTHIDLVDIAAGLEGAEAAFDSAKPALTEENAELVAKIEAEFEQAFKHVGKWGILAKDPDQARPREPGIAFVVYDEISSAEIAKFAKPIEALADLFSQAEDELDA